MAKVALIGDSHAEGLGWFLADALEARGDQLVFLADHRGWSTERMLDAGLIRQAASYDPDVILISAGHNDDGPRVERAMYEALQRLKATDARVGWILSGPSTRPDVESRHLRNRELLLRRLPVSVTLLDGRQMVNTDDLSADGVHLTREGYRKLADKIASRVPWIGRGWLWASLAALSGAVAAWFGTRKVI